MAESKYKVRLFYYTKNRPIRFIQEEELTGFLLSDVQTELNDPDIQFTNTPLMSCTVSDDGKETEDYIIEKEDLCGFLEGRTQSFKASLIDRRIRLAFGSEVKENQEITESSSIIRIKQDQDYTQLKSTGSSIPAVYEFNYNFCFLRTVILDNQPWFVSFDICQKILRLGQTEQITAILPDEDRQVCPIKSLNTVQDMEIISKAGMEKLLTRLSENILEAVRLKNWIEQIVLPELNRRIRYRKEVNVRTQEKLLPVTHIGIIKKKFPVYLYKCNNEYWLEMSQIGALLEYSEPRKAMHLLAKRHSIDLQRHMIQRHVAQSEGSRKVARVRHLINTDGLAVLYRILKDLQKKAILQDLSTAISKIVKKDISFQPEQ